MKIIREENTAQRYCLEDIPAGEVFYSEENPQGYYLRTDSEDWPAVDIETGIIYHSADFIENIGKYRIVNDDLLFLLSIEEYEEYKYNIPNSNCWWWLRSHGGDSRRAAFVSNTGEVHGHGDIVYDISIGVRPAFRESSNLKIGERIIKYEFPWIHIGGGICIAEMPIAFGRFDKESNNYYTSEIRKWINEAWINERS